MVDKEKPLLVQSDRTILLDLSSNDAENARLDIIPFAELVKSPEHMHTYTLSPLSLWNAISAGLSAEEIITRLRKWSRYDIDQRVLFFIEDTAGRYGDFILTEDEENTERLLLKVKRKLFFMQIASSNLAKKYLKPEGEGTFSLDRLNRGRIKVELIKMGFPVDDRIPLSRGERVEIDLSGTFLARDYQESAVKSFLGNGERGTGFGTIVLPCGSGKTIVALLTAYYAVKCGYQVALMAPTEILATQHFRTFSKILLPFGVKVALLTAGLPAKEKREIASAVAAGETDILIGTHALISGSVNFKNLSLAIIDEQHRFGVAERTALIAKSGSEDTLTLSATPIPRSLRLTVFGDVEVLNIERRYVGNVTTEVVVKAGKKAMLNAIAEECLRGRQAYVVAPRIRDIEGIESSSADRLYKELSKLYAGKLTVGLLHGKMKAAEKQAVLDGFYSGKISVIVSTTVIEVGIDVPNATIMAVFDADRFGLAALHQLRGRIGRNGDKGYCYLYTEKDADEQIRLKVMTEETDGLEIAERDLQIRGAGEWLGEEQSGKGGAMLPVRMMIRAKELADKVDPEVHKEELTAYALAKQLYKISLS